ncbi:hypothetical protein C6499_04245 [Candidatus Poribacteria bacterium]|nr:MAG: hypothetical protein C6499_04245 [Candidatus Poribacteria bacterium]
MKTLTSLLLILLAFFVFGCEDAENMLKPVLVEEQTNTDIPDWQYYPEKNITLNFPEWLKDGSQGQIGLGEARPHGPDRSFVLTRTSLFHEGHIYIPDASATHVYVFDMNGNMLADRTMARENILGGRASPFAPHFGNVSLDGKFLRKTHPGQSVADFLRYMKVEGNTLVIEIGWHPGFQDTWITRIGHAKSTTTYWDLSTGDISFGRTVKEDCWIRWKDKTGQKWGINTWCDVAEQEQKEIDDNDGVSPAHYDYDLIFSTEQHDYVYDIDTNVYVPDEHTGKLINKWFGCKVLTKEGVHIGWFNPDVLVHGREDVGFFIGGFIYETTLYMISERIPPDHPLYNEIEIDPYTFYAFQQN